MSEDALDGVADREELQEFERRHPAFRAALTRLQDALQLTLVRSATPVPDKPQALQTVVFFLAHQAADDFFDIVLLAAHGYGFGALKLLRPLYERVVTTMYLIAHPDEVQDFNDFADVHAWRLINHARTLGVDISQSASEQQIADIKAAYDRVEDRFARRSSWTKKDLKALADDVGLGPLYASVAFWPTVQLHTTRVAIEARLTVSAGALLFAHGPHRDEADHALRYAHDLIVYLLHKTNEFFHWGLDTADVVADVQRCWGSGGAS